MTTALDGVTVLDLGQIYNGPYCTLLLHQLGAAVVKIEPSKGEPIRWRGDGVTQSQAFNLLNVGKQGLGLDLKHPEGKTTFLDLVRRADIVVENFAPGVMERLGLDYRHLTQINPRIILASGKGFAADSVHRDLRAMDITVQAISGVLASTGFEGQAPVKAGPAVADFLAGTHLAAAVLAALYQRGITGRGQHVEVAMQDAVLPALTSNIAGYLDSGGRLPERTGNRHGGLSVCPYNVYEASDGWIAILCLRERHWSELCEVIERKDLLADPSLATPDGRVRNMEVVDEAISEWTRKRDQDRIFHLLQNLDIPCAPVRSIAEIVEDPELRRRGLLVPLDTDSTSAAREYALRSPLRLSDSEPVGLTSAPSIGQHNANVLAGLLGLSTPEISALREAGALVIGPGQNHDSEASHAAS